MGTIRARAQQEYLAGLRPTDALTTAESFVNLAQDAGDMAMTALDVTIALAKAVRQIGGQRLSSDALEATPAGPAFETE